MALAVAGTAFVRVDGRQYPLRGNFTISPSAVERTMQAGQDGVHGYQELPRVPFIEGDITLHPDLSMDDVSRPTDATITADLLNGKTYVLRNAICKDALELNSREGTVRVRWEGLSCDEIT